MIARLRITRRDLLQVGGLGLILYVAAAASLQTVHVVGGSMQPTLHDGDLLIASRLSYRVHDPQRGDIVLLRDPMDAGKEFVKRIVGLPGDRIEIRDHRVYVDGLPLREPYVHGWVLTGNWPPEPDGGRGEVIPAGDYFVMGDNRDHSSDSRAFGWVSRGDIDAKVEVRFWPVGRAEVLATRPLG